VFRDCERAEDRFATPTSFDGAGGDARIDPRVAPGDGHDEKSSVPQHIRSAARRYPDAYGVKPSHDIGATARPVSFFQGRSAATARWQFVTTEARSE
jgi:hypothetical protein